MTIQQLFLILWARRKLIAIVFAGTVGLALIACLVMPRQYTASTSVVLDVKSPDPIAGMVLPGLMAPGYMATQTDIIQSDRVAQRVVKLLKMDESAELREKWNDATDGRGSMISWLADLLERKLDVAPSRESNVINISYANSDPSMAATIANAFAQAYIDTTIELRVEPARQYSHWFDTQLKSQRDRLEQAQRALSEYQQKNGIIVTDERLDYESQRMNDLSAQLTQVQAQTTEFSSKQKLNANTLPEVVQNPLINSLKTEIAQRESRLKDISNNLGVNHPQYQSAVAELNELKSKLRSETSTIAASVSTAGSAGRIRESDIARAMDLQKAKLLELRKQRDDISVLQRDVESAQAAFDAVSQRMTQTRLEAQSVQTNVSVLTPATEPLLPSNPRVVRNLVIAAFLGALAGIAAALIAELGQRRIRSADYLGLCVGVPVLVELDSALPPNKRLGGRNMSNYLLPFAR